MIDLPWVYLVAWLVSVGIIIWRYEHRLSSWRRQLTDSQHRADFLEEELLACRTKMGGTPGNSSKDVRQSDFRHNDIGFLQPVSPALADKDDLKIVEGIGPKIEKLLHESSIYTFAELAETPTSTIKKILEKAGSRYLMHDPTTWTKQAKLANDGRWDELKKWQSELDKGRIV